MQSRKLAFKNFSSLEGKKRILNCKFPQLHPDKKHGKVHREPILMIPPDAFCLDAIEETYNKDPLPSLIQKKISFQVQIYVHILLPVKE